MTFRAQLQTARLLLRPVAARDEAGGEFADAEARADQGKAGAEAREHRCTHACCGQVFAP